MSAAAAGAAASAAASAASTGAAASAAAKRRRQVEEEVLTMYGDKALTDDWEFKILRSARGVFKERERLQRVLEEEARAGWMLVEKFDNSRIRLKRPAEAGKNDRHLDFDPWRSYVGASQNQHEARVAIIITAVVLAGVAVLGAVLFAINGPPG